MLNLRNLKHGREQDTDVKCRNYQMGLGSLANHSLSRTGFSRVHTSVQFHVLAVSCCFRVSELEYPLCSQIEEIQMVFWPIKTRLISLLLKVVTVSRAGQLCLRH